MMARFGNAPVKQDRVCPSFKKVFVKDDDDDVNKNFPYFMNAYNFVFEESFVSLLSFEKKKEWWLDRSRVSGGCSYYWAYIY
jgi:hypothetical protein